MRLRQLLSLSSCALVPVLAIACSSKDGGGEVPAPQGFTARFELPKSGGPDILQVPFPSDLMLAADGTITLPSDGTNDKPRGLNLLVPRGKGAVFVAEALARTHGFGVYAGAIFQLTGGAPDAANLPTGKAGDCTSKDSPILYVDLDAGTALECQAAWNDDSLFGEDGLAPVLVVRTARGVVIPEGHHVAVLLTSAITSKGAPLLASPEFAAIRDGQRTGAAGALYGGAIDAAATKIAGLDKRRIVAAAAYTTGHVTDELRQARELARATKLPTLKWTDADLAPVHAAKFTATTPLPTGWTASLDDLLGAPNKLTTGARSGEDDPDWGSSNPGVAHDAIGALGTASFDAPNFLEPDGDFGNPSHGVFTHAADGTLTLSTKQPTARIWVTFAIPKGTMPDKGWPVVVFQHGMGGQRGDLLAIANTYAHHGWATAAIEVVLHGTRGSDAGARGDNKSDYKRSTSKYSGPDGFIDKTPDGSNFAPTDMFGDLYRIAAMRDQFRQSAIDHTTLVRLLSSSPTLDGLADGASTPKLDGSKVAYSGDSLGGIIGAITAGIEPDHKAYVLNVPGGGIFTELAPNSPVIYGLLRGAGALFFGYQRAQLPPMHPLVTLMQHVGDGMDPLSVASTVTSPVPIAGATPAARNIVLFEVLADELVSNEATEALARAMGIPVITPHGASLLASLKEVDGAAGVHDVPTKGSTGALLQLYPAEHGGDFYDKRGHRTFDWPVPLFGDPSQEPFPRLSASIDFDEPYLELQAVATQFIDDAFKGKVPTITWTKAPAPISK